MGIGLLKNAVEIASEFGLPQSMLQEAAKSSFNGYMNAGLYKSALAIARKYQLPEEMVKEAQNKCSRSTK
jgi:phage portal protein BeeE